MLKRNIAIALPVTGQDEWHATRESFESGWLTQGPKVAEFERQFAALHGVKHALAVTSCTTGLHLALVAMGVGPGDEVIVPAFTWVATANVVLYCGATPVFVDVSPVTFNIDPEQVVAKVTDKTKVIIPVHLFGLCADMDVLRNVLPGHIKILEDAACAAGAQYKGQYAGGIGDAASFSFHPRKSITTGEGGMVTTNDDELFELMSQMRNHGATVSEEQRHHGPKPYILPDFNLLGFNYRMTDLQGAVGLAQLPKLEGFISERAKWAKYYREELADIDWLTTPSEPGNGQHGWQSFVTMVDTDKAPMGRNELMEKLQEQGVSTRPGTHAVHLLGVYRERFNLKEEDYPGARSCNDNSMAIPLHNRMAEEDYEYVVNVLKALS
ncbi:DegT/DnrJ/EryC1/StrS family aminotransferase [Aestuariirhabdus sp. Z084]|uniref:DegT/DnrJ/EryC1/StrS family aminotransferase n=1 Tax=Aestuariirhabdus haliotis TaxID=2918751 RepID=UPI0020BFC5CA|nr:DegT/DnrJ/EryC1/StrS family aminotransferase [Aestuariirhabdus haliotis]MCL6415797.1 DegT/DnrJ/EryC1/StrS family aminotransferase [Aestuariirhabdus haliotis]